jgi:hypothetical protein
MGKNTHNTTKNKAHIVYFFKLVICPSCFLCVMYISEIHRKEEIYLIDTKSPLQEATVNKVTPWSSMRWKPTP